MAQVLKSVSETLDARSAVVARWQDMALRIGGPGRELAIALEGYAGTRGAIQLDRALRAARRATSKTSGDSQRIAMVVASEMQVALG